MRQPCWTDVRTCVESYQTVADAYAVLMQLVALKSICPFLRYAVISLEHRSSWFVVVTTANDTTPEGRSEISSLFKGESNETV